jgi:hypothetical protein
MTIRSRFAAPGNQRQSTSGNRADPVVNVPTLAQADHRALRRLPMVTVAGKRGSDAAVRRPEGS